MPSPSQREFSNKHPTVTTPLATTMLVLVLLFSTIIFHYSSTISTEFSLGELRMICFVRITLNQLEPK